MRALFAGLLVLLPFSAFAHQPVQDMAPRWSDGWGLQVRQEYRASDKVLSGSSEAQNPLGRAGDPEADIGSWFVCFQW